MSQPGRMLQAMADAMRDTLEEARSDERIPPACLARMREAWEEGMRHAG